MAKEEIAVVRRKMERKARKGEYRRGGRNISRRERTQKAPGKGGVGGGGGGG